MDRLPFWYHRRVLLVLVLLVLLAACACDTAPIVLSPSEAEVEFGAVDTGAFQSVTVTVSHMGTYTAVADAPSMGGDGSAAFVVSGGEWPLQMEPGDTVDLQVTFSPIAE